MSIRPNVSEETKEALAKPMVNYEDTPSGTYLMEIKELNKGPSLTVRKSAKGYPVLKMFAAHSEAKGFNGVGISLVVNGTYTNASGETKDLTTNFGRWLTALGLPANAIEDIEIQADGWEDATDENGRNAAVPATILYQGEVFNPIGHQLKVQVEQKPSEDGSRTYSNAVAFYPAEG